MKLIIVNGPNLNLLGEREPEIYGRESLEQINTWIRNHELCKDLVIDFFQSNSEGEIIDFLHSKRNIVDYCVLNAGALTHYSYALRDAIVSSQIPTVEVHLSNIYKRENFRKNSVIKNVCMEQFYGEGKQSYINGIKHILEKK
tara:strand:- start:994 stop:1422 length:429 start_codon:yes stop_codon:yes gene_type:complete